MLVLAFEKFSNDSLFEQKQNRTTFFEQVLRIMVFKQLPGFSQFRVAAIYQNFTLKNNKIAYNNKSASNKLFRIFFLLIVEQSSPLGDAICMFISIVVDGCSSYLFVFFIVTFSLFYFFESKLKLHIMLCFVYQVDIVSTEYAYCLPAKFLYAILGQMGNVKSSLL